MVDDSEFDTPSRAAVHVTGRMAVSGWTFWRFEGVLISDLRWRLRTQRFVEGQSEISESYRVQKQRVINGWMEWTLAQGSDPGTRDMKAVEKFLGERDLMPGTLANYRRYLHEWFEIYDPT